MLEARCALCGKVTGVEPDHKDFKKLSENPQTTTFICDMCSNRVRYESEDQQKPKKPM
ncbi:MAG: DUF2197 domain-containing protein [Solirubrobacterales bacterium]